METDKYKTLDRTYSNEGKTIYIDIGNSDHGYPEDRNPNTLDMIVVLPDMIEDWQREAIKNDLIEIGGNTRKNENADSNIRIEFPISSVRSLLVRPTLEKIEEVLTSHGFTSPQNIDRSSVISR